MLCSALLQNFFFEHSIRSIIYKYSDGDVDNWVGGKGDKGGDGGGTDLKKDFWDSKEFSNDQWLWDGIFRGSLIPDFLMSGFLIPEFGDFLKLGFCILGFGDFIMSGFFIPGFGEFLKSGFFIPGFWDFSKSGEFYPGDWKVLSRESFSGDWGFFTNGDFYPQGLGIFENKRIFIPG